MKTLIKSALVLVLFSLTTCDKDHEFKTDVYTLNSTPSNGFIFSGLRIISYSSSTTKPDFIVLAQINIDGDVVAPYLSHPDLENRFFLSKEFRDSVDAQEYFDSYLEPENKPLVDLAYSIKPNQIWLIKTNSGGYGKILIVGSRVDTLDNNTPFAEIKFKAENME